MEQLRPLLDYFAENPSHAAGLAILVVVGIYLMNRPSKVVRQAERRLEELREERGDYYRNLRPPQ